MSSLGYVIGLAAMGLTNAHFMGFPSGSIPMRRPSLQSNPWEKSR